MKACSPSLGQQPNRWPDFRQKHLEPALRRACLGFTLVELVIVLAILGLLVTIAAPDYQSFAARGRRAAAIASLLDVASCQERRRAIQGRYNRFDCLPASNPEGYQLAYAEPGGDQQFTVIANPLSAQERDRCGALTLDHLGTRQVGGSADPLRCWTGR